MTAELEMVADRTVRSRWLGEIGYNPESELFFPDGLPGFEYERRMLPVEIPSQRPLVYLQSLANPEICFAALPVFVIHSGFELRLSEEDRAALDLWKDDPAPGVDVLCLALLISCGEGVRANLNAPVVINLHNSHAVQCVSVHDKAVYFRLTDSGRWESQC